MKPSRLSAHLRSVAERIDRSRRPSRSAVAAELRRVLAAVDENGDGSPESISLDDLKGMLVAQIHAYDVDKLDFVSSDSLGDQVSLAERFLRSHGIKVMDLTDREGLPASPDPDSVKVAVDLHFLDGDKTIIVDSDSADSSGIRVFVDSLFKGVYSALGESGWRLPPEISSPFEPDHHDVSLVWDGSSFHPESDE